MRIYPPFSFTSQLWIEAVRINNLPRSYFSTPMHRDAMIRLDKLPTSQMQAKSTAKRVKQEKPVKPARQKPDLYGRLLNSNVMAVLYDKSKISGVLVEVSPYAILIENVDGTTW